MKVEVIEGEDQGSKGREACKDANQGSLGTMEMNRVNTRKPHDVWFDW